MRCDRWQLVPFLVTLLLSTPSPHSAARHTVEPGCRFPSRWTGTWFQSGVRQPIIIQDSRLSAKGRCIATEGDKFLLVDDKGVCYRCVVIHEKHENVLQYKETHCLESRGSLHSSCSLITGDALLFSMFREAATSVPCPFRGGHTFTYNRGHGECRYPVSTIESCTQDSRLLLRYQACPDVHGTESTVEELQCLATWKEGSSRYLVGKVHHTHATSNEDSYRCFVYEKTSGTTLPTDLFGEEADFRSRSEDVEYRVAQSGDATCNGLFSPMEGSRTMTLKKAAVTTKCRFPSWLTQSQHWHSLDYTRSYSFHHRNTTLRISNLTLSSIGNDGPGVQQQYSSSQDMEQDVRVICTEVLQATNDMAYIITHYTMGCVSGYMCMTFYKRDTHVIEVQSGSHTRRSEDACSISHFDKNNIPFTTLVTTNPEQKKCPHFGKFSVTGVNRKARHTRSHNEDNARNVRSDMVRLLSSKDSYSQHESNWFEYSENNDFHQLHDNSNVRYKRYLIEHDGTQSGSSESPVSHIQGKPLDRSHKQRRDLEAFAATEACSLDFKTLIVGCGSTDTMEFRSDCHSPDTNIISAYSCHGGWSENGTNYLITTPLSRSSRGARRYCFVYQSQADTVVRFSTSADNCRRDIIPGSTGILAFNITNQGQCTEINTSARITSSHLLACLLAGGLIWFSYRGR